MELPRIATHYISTDKTDNLIHSWYTIKSIVNEVLEDCFNLTGHGTLQIMYTAYWRIGGKDDDDKLYLTALNPCFIVMHTFDNKDNPFFKILHDKILNTITIHKCIDVSNTQPFFTCEEGLEMMSNAVDRIIGKLEETFGKKEEETKMTEKELYDMFEAKLMEAAKRTVSRACEEQSKTRATIVPKKKGNKPFIPSIAEIGFNKLVKKIIINRPSIIVFWNDNTKTVVTCNESDAFDPEIGICIAFTKKYLGNTGNYHQILRRILKNAKNVTGNADKKREKKKAKKEAAKREKDDNNDAK